MTSPISQRINAVLDCMPFYRFITETPWFGRLGEPGVCDFVFGNPHEMPLPGFVEALQRQSGPQNEMWFAYKVNEPGSRAVVAQSLRQHRGLAFEEEDIFLTNGAFAAIAVALAAVVDPGDEVMFVSPPWFFYEAMIAGSGATPVRVKIDPVTFDLDVEAIARAITPRTRGLIVNSPHNPTGKIYPPETLKRLAELLSAASERNGRTIYLFSDEAYSRIIYDGQAYHSPTAYYPNTLLIYTYGKTLLTPGQRIGYIALPPTMPEREALRKALLVGQILTGFAFPNALLQHALADLEKLSIDVEHLQWKRDWLVGALREMGYEANKPDGTFYVMVRSPWADDGAFVNMLAEADVFCLPGTIVEMPGYFRLSITANDAMIEQALPRFAAALQRARETQPA